MTTSCGTSAADSEDGALLALARPRCRLASDDDLHLFVRQAKWLNDVFAVDPDDPASPSPDGLALALAYVESARRELRWRRDHGLRNPAMTFGFPREILREIKSRLSLADEVGLFVELRPRGRLQYGLCPFHIELTASFVVYPDNHWFCFGCRSYGDLFDFIRAMQPTWSFAQAVNYASARAGVDLAPRPSVSAASRLRVREVGHA